MNAPILIIRQDHDMAEGTKPDTEVIPRLTPEEQLQAYELAHGELTRAQRERYLEAQPYKNTNLEKMSSFFGGPHDIAPDNLRISIKSISEEDAALTGVLVPHDARKCLAHEILAIGPAVQRHLDKNGVPDDTRETRSVWRKLKAWISGRGARAFSRPMPGDHCFVLSTVADRASKTDPTVRLWTVHVDDVSLRWPKPGA